MTDKLSSQKSEKLFSILKFILGLTPGILLAIYSYIWLLKPDLELEGLIPVGIMTIGGFLMFLVGGVFLIASYIKKRNLYFSVGVGLGGLLLITSWFLYILIRKMSH